MKQNLKVSFLDSSGIGIVANVDWRHSLRTAGESATSLADRMIVPDWHELPRLFAQKWKQIKCLQTHSGLDPATKGNTRK
jgi:hypothetical protein